MKFYEPRLALLIDEPKCMNSESFHHAIAARDCAVGHHPEHHVHGLRHEGDEIPKGVVR